MQRVVIEDFDGPLDLLLTLVQQEELSLTRIRLLEILDQIIDGLNHEHDLNDSGDMIMIISTLMELKSKLLLPGEVDIGEEIQALKEDLLAKILVHRRLSQVLDALENRFQRRRLKFSRPSQISKKEQVILPMGEQNPFVLFSSLSYMLEQVRQDSYRVDYVILPIDHYFKWLEESYSDKTFTIFQVGNLRKDPLDLTGILIAVLELVRQGSLRMSLLENDVKFDWIQKENDPEAIENMNLVEQ